MVLLGQSIHAQLAPLAQFGGGMKGGGGQVDVLESEPAAHTREVHSVHIPFHVARYAVGRKQVVEVTM